MRGFAVFVVVVLVYFVPMFIAVARGVRRTDGLFALNLLLGWLGIGWIAAVIWACRAETEQEHYARTVGAAREADRARFPTVH